MNKKRYCKFNQDYDAAWTPDLLWFEFIVSYPSKDVDYLITFYNTGEIEFETHDYSGWYTSW